LWQVTSPLLGLILAMLTLMTACSATARNSVGAPLAPSPRVLMQPANGATGINPVGPTQISVIGGVFDAVRLANPGGKAVAGALSANKTVWTVSEPLGYDKTYTWSGTATGSDGKQIPSPRLVPHYQAR